MKRLMMIDRPKKRKIVLPTHGKPICKECGYRIRGKIAGHEAGEHHKSGGMQPKFRSR